MCICVCTRPSSADAAGIDPPANCRPYWINWTSVPGGGGSGAGLRPADDSTSLPTPCSSSAYLNSGIVALQVSAATHPQRAPSAAAPSVTQPRELLPPAFIPGGARCRSNRVSALTPPGFSADRARPGHRGESPPGRHQLDPPQRRVPQARAPAAVHRQHCLGQ